MYCDDMEAPLISDSSTVAMVLLDTPLAMVIGMYLVKPLVAISFLMMNIFLASLSLRLALTS